jgi:peroxiredoxin
MGADMKTKSLIALALIIASLATGPTAVSASGRFSPTEPTSHPKTKGLPPGPGSMAPNVVMTDTSGTSFTLSSLRGQVVVLEWTNFECPYVARHYSSGDMQTVQRTAMAQGIKWITILSSAPGKQGFLDARGADYFTAQKNSTPSAKVLDPTGAVGRAFGARTTPHMFVINPRGEIIYAGAIDDQPRAVVAAGTPTRNYVLEALAAHRSGHTPAVRATAAYGCSIKY